MRAKLIGDFRDAVQRVLAQASTSGILTEPNTFNEVKAVPPPLSEAIISLGDKAADLRQRLTADDHREDCRPSLDAADALMALRKATEDIQAANTPGARTDLALFYEGNPLPATDEQKPLRKSLDALRELCNRQEAQAMIHLQRARSAADAGKSGDAMKEYQEALRLDPDPETARTMKRLREDSLGL